MYSVVLPVVAIYDIHYGHYLLQISQAYGMYVCTSQQFIAACACSVGEYVVCGQYVADYSTTECRTFRPEGLRQLHTKLRMYSVRLVYIAMGNCV